jgi:Raf kinase inhibitor-like YbhB/YbcL family protein
MPRRLPLVLVALAVVASLSACDTDDGRDSLARTEAGPDQTQTILTTTAGSTVGEVISAETVPTTLAPPMTLTAPWADEGVIDVRYTCKGDDVAPALSWQGVPEGTQELAVVMIDVSADGFVHWVMTGLDPGLPGLTENELPEGAVLAENDFGERAYGGPCPPESHSYLLTLYALGQELELIGDEQGSELLFVIEESVVGQVSVGGTFPA